MSSFEYLGILVSVVLGLALTRLITGLSVSMIRQRQVKTYWVQRAWTAGIWLYVLGIWWGMVSWDFLPQWTYTLFLFIMLYATILFLLADSLYPHSMTPGTDLKQYFYAQRKWFFGLLALGAIVDVPETLLKASMGLRPVPGAYPLFVGPWFIMAVIGYATDNQKVHSVLAIAWPALTLLYVAGAIPVLWRG